MQEITQDKLKYLFKYNPVDGNFIWLKSSRNRPDYIGRIAGSVHDNGYLYISIERKLHRAHRLAFLYMNGELPINYVDHINHDKLDNRWSNLRECTHKENMFNQLKRKNASSIYKGVSWNDRAKKWVSYIKKDGNPYHLGYFINEVDAAIMYNKKATELFGKFSLLNKIKVEC